MKRFALAAVVVLAFASEPAAAQTLPPACADQMFVTVDAVSVNYGTYIVITGVVQGDSAPSTCRVNPSGTSAQDLASQCERLALLAMTKPGQYLLQVHGYQPGWPLAYCKLIKVNP